MAYQFEGLNDPVKPGQRKKIRISKFWDRLTQESVAAANAGMSYGKWKAQQREGKRSTGVQ